MRLCGWCCRPLSRTIVPPAQAKSLTPTVQSPLRAIISADPYEGQVDVGVRSASNSVNGRHNGAQMHHNVELPAVLVAFLLLVLVSPSMMVRRRLVYLVARIAVVSKAQRWTWQQVCVIVVGFSCSVFSRFYAEAAPTAPRPMCRSEARSRESAIDWQSAAGSQDTQFVI